MTPRLNGPTVSTALESIPPVDDRRLAMQVTPDALRRIRAGHPWVYDRSIVSVKRDGAPGDLAVVFDRRDRFAAIGLFDPESPIRLKVLHFGTPVAIDSAWFASRIDRACVAREAAFGSGAIEAGAHRLVNGENDGLPGLVVDRYADVLVVKSYSAAWWPWLRTIVELLTERTGATGVVLRLARLLQDADGLLPQDGEVIAGHVPDGPVLFMEGGLRFEADVRSGQKTGHFIDQRGNRALAGSMAQGAAVLDLFASTGGFGVYAAAGGAKRVHSVDVSAPTLAVAERNMALNASLPNVAACGHTTEVGDAFVVMERLAAARKVFDMVVVDPPSFAQRQDRVESALRAYARLTTLACGVLRPGGVLVQASCSSRVSPAQFFGTVASAAMLAGREIGEIARTGHEPDHPVTFPEGEYLKAGFWTVAGRR
jgi:23S rRNA (cytosine1962-C5)-methyltransferase